MATWAPRRRVSSSVSSDAGVIDLQNHLKDFSISFQDQDQRNIQNNQQNLQFQLHAGQFIRQLLLGGSNSARVQDIFRHLNGFQVVLQNIEHLSRTFQLCQPKKEDLAFYLDLLQTSFGVLSAALQDHKGNKNYFRECREGGGWKEVRHSLESLLQYREEEDSTIRDAILERVFGCLLCCAINDESMVEFFGKLRRQTSHTDSLANMSLTKEDNNHTNVHLSNGNSTTQSIDAKTTSAVDKFIRKEIASIAVLQSPDSMVIMLELWKALESISTNSNNSTSHLCAGISFAVPKILIHCTNLSTHALTALHSTRLLSVVLSYLLVSALSPTQIFELCSLASTLLQLGVTCLDDAYLLFRNATTSSTIANILLKALHVSGSPSYVHFDLSLHGFASIELPGIERDFPPVSSSTGYTICLWAYFVTFDSNAHTTLFGAFDSTQTCFVLVYLEKDSRNLILQTSVTSSRPSVRFRSTSFQDRRWYHISIVHRRPRTTSSSRASLFIDGEFVEQAKSQYPSSPPSMNFPAKKPSSLSLDQKNNSIQAFFGTPQDLASKLGKGFIFSQWRLASAHVFGDALSDDLLAVYHQLGPRYSGNYQDCLGSFQTYQASAALNLRNESLHPGKEERSDIISAIRSKASSLLPESKILISISPTSILDDDDYNNVDETQLVKSMSLLAVKKLRSVTRGRNALAINGSIPSINEALLHPFGFAVLTGDPAVTVPQSLDDASWRVGGCVAVGLALLDTADTRDAILSALKILFSSVKESWRNSEAMERENGFGVLANLIAVKAESDPAELKDEGNHSCEPLSLEILMLVLEFVGYRAEKPEDSVINNPLAYRVLLVDSETWRGAVPVVQKLYYEQFTVFSVKSKYHFFNIKRLSRMR